MTIKNLTCSKDQWSLIESGFDAWHLGKTEVLMSQGNGYLGLRATTEENYYSEKRNMFVAGTFNKAAPNEVTELPNLPDIVQIRLKLNGESFNLNVGKTLSYSKSLNVQTSELVREIKWWSVKTGNIDIKIQRFVSSYNRHLVCQKITIIPEEMAIDLVALSGINGQVSNSGAQHFIEGEKRLYDGKTMTYSQHTSESNIGAVVVTNHQIFLDEIEVAHNLHILMERRQIHGRFDCHIKKNSTFEMVKYSMVGTSRDVDFENYDVTAIKSELVRSITAIGQQGYQRVFDESVKALQEKLWQQATIDVISEEPMDLFSIRFAQYQLYCMTPLHDNRLGIGAKGLTGEGYKGHSFWDTEVFIFPYYLYTQPQLARQLLEYRYHGLVGAKEKAKINGYEGAMYPWESAWMDDGEVTPTSGAADIMTGKATKIWCGFIELHITADIVFAIYQYYNVTKDEGFMNLYGYEIVFETANFWTSRVEAGEDGYYHINKVIGADEYKEHIDDNAFTNYLVYLNLELSIKYAEKLQSVGGQVYERLSEKFDFAITIPKWREKMDNLYLPEPNCESIIPQDRTYLQKECIDLTKYKEQTHVGSIFEDFNQEQVNKIQVSKQADVMMLFYLREDLFGQDVKKLNWDYYEPKTLHDSSLSLSVHSIIANDLGERKLAYDLFVQCRAIDLGPDMNSSNHGIHAASLGGILQVAMNGFGGVRVLDGLLRIEPQLPENWSELTFPFIWRKDQLEISVFKEYFSVENMTKRNKIIEFSAFGANYLLSEKTIIHIV